MRVLITGGAGYIGSHCNKYFSQKGIDTVVLDNLLFGHREAVKYGTFIKGDFGDAVLLRQLFSQNSFDAVIHFGALADVEYSVERPDLFYDVNIARMLVLINSMLENNVTKIIFSSSAACFGEPQYIPIDEEHPQHPISPYGFTKYAGERILEDYYKAYGLKYIALRYFNAAGADIDGELGESHQPEHHLLPLIFQTALGKRNILDIYGSDYNTTDGTCIRDFVHVNDIAAAHHMALEYLLEGGNPICLNLGSSEGISILRIVNYCNKILKVPIQYQIVDRRPGDPARLVAANIKIKQVLNWMPKYSDIDTIIRTGWNWELQRSY